ncbi:uncharacterized protein LOC126560662 [Anopheles maculipalpis]|uniref:uncharacterized protein LOC126560662 n=1 Tax=Anopheles maculipalpis TaxID=1496333 RepID=UPI0021593CF1|nr:uncharacterized protein LOC126560662 [Anopheles maculipalpis]
MVKADRLYKNTGESTIQSTMNHVLDKGSFLQQDGVRARLVKRVFYTTQQHFYQPTSFISDSSSLCDELKRVQQLQAMLLFMQQQQQHQHHNKQQQLQTPAFMSGSLQSSQQPTNRNRIGMMTRQQFASGSAASAMNTNATTSAAVDRTVYSHSKQHFVSVHDRLPKAFHSYNHWLEHVKRLHLDEQQCMVASMQAQLLYNWYRVWEATDQHNAHWWKNRTNMRTAAIQTSTICPLQNVLFQAFYQLMSSAGEGGYFHPFIHFDLRHSEKQPTQHKRHQNTRRGQYRTEQSPPTKVVSVATPAGATLPKPINATTGRSPSIANSNPLTPFLFVYVPLLTPLPAPQQLAFAVNHSAGSGPLVSPGRTALPPSGLPPPSTCSLDAIINDRLVQPFVYAPISNDN